MIVVLDTDVLVSATLSPKGNPAKILNRWEADEFEVVTSPPLIHELERVLTCPRVRRRLQLSDDEMDTLLKRLSVVATIVDPHPNLDVIQTDPADNRVLECAAAGEATYIVTGDNHLLGLKEYQQVVILDPAAFLAVLQLEDGRMISREGASQG